MSSFLNIKEKLAKLLATENLNVQFSSSVPTASFEPESRVLTVPILKDGLENSVYNLFIAHEASHALYSPVDSIRTVEKLGIPLDVANVVEDVRIEKAIQQRYPGLRKDFREGYTSLHERDFFGIKDKDISVLNFLDRINLHYKLGSLALIPFSDEEKEMVSIVDTCKTFEDVIEVSRQLIQFVNEQKEKEEQTKFDESISGQSGNTENEQYSNQSGGEDSPEDEQQSEESSTQSQNQSSSESESQTQDSNSQSESFEGGKSTLTQGNTNKVTENPFESQTQRNFDQQLTGQVERGISVHQIDTPESSVYEHMIPVSYVRKYMKSIRGNSTFGDIYIEKDYKHYLSNSRSEVNFMVQQFQMKKSADEYRRSGVSKTGVLDMNRIHNYKIDDDIFIRNTVLPEGKNHGMYMLLDFSGSMAENIRGVIRQTLTLVQFCRKVGIPFEVVAFSNTTDARFELLAYKQSNSCYRHEVFESKYSLTKEKEDHLMYGSLTLIQLISSNASPREIDQDMYNLYYFAQKHYEIPMLSLGGTPLDAALIGMLEVIPDFQSKNNLQKVTLVVLTDGDSHGMEYSYTTRIRYSSSIVYRNRFNKRTYKTSYYHTTQTFLTMLQDYLHNVNIVNYYIGSRSSCQRYLIGYNDSDYRSTDKLKTGLKKDNSFYYKPTNNTYDSIIFLHNSIFMTDAEIEMEDSDGPMTKSQLRKSFTTMLKKRNSSIKVLSEFMTLVS